MRNTTDTSQPDSTSSKGTKKLKLYKRGKWVKVTRGPKAGTKRWFSAETRNKMALTAQVNFSKRGRENLTTYVEPPTPKEQTTVTLSKETAEKVRAFMGEGVTFEETVEYIVSRYLSTVSVQKLGKVIQAYTPPVED